MSTAVLSLGAHFLGLQDAAAALAGLGEGLAVEHVLGHDFPAFPVFIAGVFDFFKLVGMGFNLLLKLLGVRIDCILGFIFSSFS